MTVVVDNDSWILPYAERIVGAAQAAGDDAKLVRDHKDVFRGEVAFYLGCIKITPPEVLAENVRNLVIHESDLPTGRGFSPMTWQIIDGTNDIPVCLFEATAELDAGPIIYKNWIRFEGHELISELRHLVGERHISLCMRFLNEPEPPEGIPQVGEPTSYRRRTPADSRLDPKKTLAEQFNLLRTVDNERYPAYLDHRGCRYILYIEKTSQT